MSTWNLADLRLCRVEMLGRARSNIRYARENWVEDDERWASLNRAVALLKRKDATYTAAEMEDVMPWGMLSPCDDLVLAGVIDPPAPVIRGALARERSYNRVRAVITSTFLPYPKEV